MARNCDDDCQTIGEDGIDILFSEIPLRWNIMLLLAIRGKCSIAYLEISNQRTRAMAIFPHSGNQYARTIDRTLWRVYILMTASTP